MPSPATPHLPPAGARKGTEPTAALFVRIPTEYARRLDRAAFELRVPKQSLVSELVERYVDPDSPASRRPPRRGHRSAPRHRGDPRPGCSSPWAATPSGPAPPRC